MEQEWETALHDAAAHGDLEMARLGAPARCRPNVKDSRFDSTLLG
jgi:hypothetical protein